MKLLLVISFATFFNSSLQGSRRKPGFGPGEQDWGWYRARKVAYYFYWLFYTQAPDALSPYDKPLVIYLSGGPGISSTGYGNFAEVGPLFANGTKRPSSWADYVNLLFVDIPVGTGYSYVEFGNNLAQNNQEIGADMVRFLIKFYKNHPEFTTVPMYIFGEGYGAKMTVEIAKQLAVAIKENRLMASFTGVGLGDPWISPLDSCLSWAPLFLQRGWINKEGHDKIAKATQFLQKAIENERFSEAFRHMLKLKHLIREQNRNITFENEFKSGRVVNELMENEVRLALRIPEDIKYEYESHSVLLELKEDFMKPVTSVVEELLNNTNLKVAVYNGGFNPVVNTNGTQQWMDRLQWPGSYEWANTRPNVEYGMVKLLVKSHKNLFFYIVFAGNPVPITNPQAGIEILRRVTEFDINIEDRKSDLWAYNSDDLFNLIPADEDK